MTIWDCRFCGCQVRRLRSGQRYVTPLCPRCYTLMDYAGYTVNCGNYRLLVTEQVS